MRHIIWDWNGTLFADQPIVLAAVNDALRAVGSPPVSAAGFRRVAKRPVRPFYEAIAGRPLSDAEWETVDECYHRAYLRRLDSVALDPHAAGVLGQCAAAGFSQSLLSMWPHDELVPLVGRHSIAGCFNRIDGFRGECGGEKREHLAEHLAALREEFGIAPEEAAVVGDSVDDAVAARLSGCLPVLLVTGTYDRDLLERQPAAVVDDLPACLRHLTALRGGPARSGRPAGVGGTGT